MKSKVCAPALTVKLETAPSLARLFAGGNDVTVLLKPQSGSRRWQHLSMGKRTPSSDRLSPVESNYTVILGSHRNTCLKFEKDGELVCMVDSVPGAKLQPCIFNKFWINYEKGVISVGSGDPKPSHAHYTWKDPDPIEGIRFIGLSAWDTHVAYKSVIMHPALNLSDAGSTNRKNNCPWSLLSCAISATLSSLTPSTVCAVLQVVDCLAPVLDGSLRPSAIDLAALHFEYLPSIDPRGFCSLSSHTVEDILKCPELVCQEKCIFDALMVWAGYGQPPADGSSPCRPLWEVDCLLPLVRFPLMSGDELCAIWRTEMTKRSLLLRDLLDEASASSTGSDSKSLGRSLLTCEGKRTVRVPGHNEVIASSRLMIRRTRCTQELVYVYDGDHNGICWYLGTCCGSQKWVNPVLGGRLNVIASSPECRNTNSRALVGGVFLRNNFAGPKVIHGGQKTSWWILDFGDSQRLAVNYYTLRTDGSQDFLRSWVLQGSMDGQLWVDLRRHLSDTTFRMPGQWASWPIVGHAAAIPYRMFRVLLVGPNTDAPNPHHICLSNIELYGSFYDLNT